MGRGEVLYPPAEGPYGLNTKRDPYSRNVPNPLPITPPKSPGGRCRLPSGRAPAAPGGAAHAANDASARSGAAVTPSTAR
jgi:hypothetical protein